MSWDGDYNNYSSCSSHQSINETNVLACNAEGIIEEDKFIKADDVHNIKSDLEQFKTYLPDGVVEWDESLDVEQEDTIKAQHFLILVDRVNKVNDENYCQLECSGKDHNENSTDHGTDRQTYDSPDYSDDSDSE